MQRFYNYNLMNEESDNEDECSFLMRCGDGDEQANTNQDSYLPYNA
jgi:hypothetical protein